MKVIFSDSTYIKFPMIHILSNKTYLTRKKDRVTSLESHLCNTCSQQVIFTFFLWVRRIRAGSSTPHSCHPEEVTPADPIPGDVAAKGSLQPLYHSVVNDFSPYSMVQNMMNQGTVQWFGVQKKYWTWVGQWWHTANITSIHNHHTSHVYCLQYWYLHHYYYLDRTCKP